MVNERSTDEVSEMLKEKVVSLKDPDESGVFISCTDACGWELQLNRGFEDFPHYCPDCGARTEVDVEYSTIERENQKTRDI